MKRAAIYLRVSTKDQHPENQRPELEEMVRGRGYELAGVYEETISGAAYDRPEFDRMLIAAHRRQISALFVWSIDRIGRRMLDVCHTVENLDAMGVATVSARESWLDMTNPLARKILLAVFSGIAEFERERLIERTHAGLDRARSKGIKLGRPQARVDLIRARLLELRGLSVRAIARELDVPLGTLQRALARSDPKSGVENGGGKPPKSRPARA